MLVSVLLPFICTPEIIFSVGFDVKIFEMSSASEGMGNTGPAVTMQELILTRGKRKFCRSCFIS